MIFPKDDSLKALREAYNALADLHISSVAVLSTAFLPLLQKAPQLRVINISSGLGSMTNQKIRKVGRFPVYGVSKVGENGVTVHMQVAENDRNQEPIEKGSKVEGRIKFYTVMPGVLKTAGFSKPLGLKPSFKWPTHAKDAKEGAEVITRLITAPEGTYEGGTFWEFEGGEMRVAPW